MLAFVKELGSSLTIHCVLYQVPYVASVLLCRTIGSALMVTATERKRGSTRKWAQDPQCNTNFLVGTSGRESGQNAQMSHNYHEWLWNLVTSWSSRRSVKLGNIEEKLEGKALRVDNKCPYDDTVKLLADSVFLVFGVLPDDFETKPKKKKRQRANVSLLILILLIGLIY